MVRGGAFIEGFPGNSTEVCGGCVLPPWLGWAVEVLVLWGRWALAWPWPGNPWLQAVGLNTLSLLHHGALQIGLWFQKEVAGEGSRLSCGCNAKGIFLPPSQGLGLQLKHQVTSND